MSGFRFCRGAASFNKRILFAPAGLGPPFRRFAPTLRPQMRALCGKMKNGANMRIVNSIGSWIVLLLLHMPAFAGAFGEGYSSTVPGGSANINFRAFTIYTRQEACEKSPFPSELRVLPNPLILKIGDRVHRSNVSNESSELSVEAYGSSGEFLPAVPIIVSTADVQNVTASRSDWDYLEAVREGEGELVVSWACTSPDGQQLEARVQIIVTTNSGTND